MKKLNNIIASNNVTAYVPRAIWGLEDRSNPDGESVIISTDSSSAMGNIGVTEYYSIIMPRNSEYTSPDDVMAADLNVELVHIEVTEEIPSDAPVIIHHEHPGIVGLLKGMYPDSIVLTSVTLDNIANKNVVGSLPDNLIQYTAWFQAVAIEDYDIDGDLSGDRLKERMIITKAVHVTIK